MCHSRSWNTSRLLLALPNDGNRAKSAVITFTYDTGINTYRYQPLVEWIHDRVGRRIHHSYTRNELTRWMHQSCQPSASNVCLILVTSLTLPPFFISALSVKFNGRVKFGMVDHHAAAGQFGDDEEDEEESGGGQSGRGKQSRSGIGRYVIISPTESSLTTYGGRSHRREPINYQSLHTVLKWLTPDSNDIFVISVALTNLLALFSLFECRGHPIKIFLHFAWTAFKYNFVLLLIWACFLSVINYRSVIDLCAMTASILRRFCFTTFGRAMIDNWLEIRRQTSSRIGYMYGGLTRFVISFLGFNTLIHYARRRFNFLGGLRQLDDSRSFGDRLVADGPFRGGDWFVPPSIANGLRFAPIGVTTLWGGIGLGGSSSDGEGGRRHFLLDDPMSEGLADMDPKLEALIRRLNIRRVCLDPRVPYDYVLELQLVQYGKNQGQDNRTVEIKPKSQSCPVCLDTYKDGDTLCILPCQHDYHHRCILSWLFQDQPTCPCCRQPANVGTKEKAN